MLKATEQHQQTSFFGSDLIDQLDPKDPLLLLSNAIPWQEFEKDFIGEYTQGIGRPSIEQYPGSLSVDRAAVVSDGLLDELDDLAGSVHLVCEFIAESRPDLVGGGEPVGEVLVELGR